MKQETVIMILESLMSEYSKKFSESEKVLKVRNWCTILKDLSDEDGVKGLEKALETAFDFMPSVGKFKELCTTTAGHGSIEDEANEAWYIVMSNLNYYASPVFKNTVIAETIRKMGGWKTICSMETKDEPFRKKDFIAMYSINRKRNEEYKPNLLGAGDIENKVFIGYQDMKEIKEIEKFIESGKSAEKKALVMFQQKIMEQNDK